AKPCISNHRCPLGPKFPTPHPSNRPDLLLTTCAASLDVLQISHGDHVAASITSARATLFDLPFRRIRLDPRGRLLDRLQARGSPDPRGRLSGCDGRGLLRRSLQLHVQRLPRSEERRV